MRTEADRRTCQICGKEINDRPVSSDKCTKCSKDVADALWWHAGIGLAEANERALERGQK